MEDYLNMNETHKYNIIKAVVNGRKSKARAEVELNLSRRQINRLILKYKQEGRKGFRHKNANRKPSKTIDRHTRKRIVQLYRSKYYDFNFTHFHEKLQEVEEILLSESSLRNILKEAHIVSPLATRRTKRRVAKELEDKADKKGLTPHEKETLQEVQVVEASKAHPSRPRCKHAGELLQMDASEHQWFEADENYYYLHAAIDDATGTVVGAYFAAQETLEGYYQVSHQFLTHYGIPHRILTDYRSIFSGVNTPKKGAALEEQALTQYGYACQTLGIELEATSVPQAKGRIERLFGTFQNRLLQEMRLNGIRNMDEANQFLRDYLPQFNQKFAHPIKDSINAFEKLSADTNLDYILARFALRVIHSGHTVRYNNHVYHLYDQHGRQVHLPRKTKVMVISTRDLQLFVSHKNQLFKLIEMPSHQAISKILDIQEAKSKPKPHIPPMSHPWKGQSYQRYLKKQEYIKKKELIEV